MHDDSKRFSHIALSSIFRLNSGIFRILELSKLNLNLKSSDSGALKIISNDNKLESISWEPNVENQISTLNFTYQNDQCKNLYLVGDFGNETPTHMGTTHAISKFQPKFQNRITRELDQNFYMPGIGMIH